MKKILYFASALLAVFMTYSCSSIEDNPTSTNIPVTIEDADGVKHEVYQIATFKGEVDTEVSLKLGVYESEDMYFVDFGDGKMLAQKVGIDNKGPVREDGSTPTATEFKGTVAGDGIITVYGKNDLWYLNASGNAMPTSFDQDKLKKVVQMSFTGVNVDKVELPQLDSLSQFSFNNSPVQSVDVSKCVKLTWLTINSTTASKYEPQLESIDVSALTELEYLSLQAATNKRNGKLTKIDLSNNKKLEKVYLNDNQITEIVLGENIITDFNASNNLLESFDMSKLTGIKNIYLTGNKLKELDLSGITNKGNIQIANNLFTLATLPTKPAVTTTSKYTYAPQPAYEVAEAITDQNNLLDLSSQLTATGVATEPQTTTYTFLAGTTELKENEDYKVVEPGKFTFLKSQTEKVHAVMATDAFPKFTGNNAYVTTEFTVTVTASTSVEARTWDFTKWSDETIANLKADAAASKISGWSDVEKKADAEAGADPTEASKDNCFWLTAETTDANGKAIAELEGLVFDADYCAKRSLAIAVNYPSTSLGTYDGSSYLWLGGGGSKQTCPCFTIPSVKAGQKITFVMESHKPTDARGIGLYKNSYDSANLIGEQFKPTTKASNTWEITEDCDVVVWNTSGCHIYSIEVK